MSDRNSYLRSATNLVDSLTDEELRVIGEQPELVRNFLRKVIADEKGHLTIPLERFSFFNSIEGMNLAGDNKLMYLGDLARLQKEDFCYRKADGSPKKVKIPDRFIAQVEELLKSHNLKWGMKLPRWKRPT